MTIPIWSGVAAASWASTAPYSDFLTAGITFRGEDVSTDNVTLLTQDQFIRQNGTVIGLGARGIFSNRDNEQSRPQRAASAPFPTRSSLPAPARQTIWPSARSRRGARTSASWVWTLRQYTSLEGPRKPGNFNQPKRVLATRLLIGTTAKNIPFFEQYFIGGADSLRGYDTDRFWGSNTGALSRPSCAFPSARRTTTSRASFCLMAEMPGAVSTSSRVSVSIAAFQLQADYGLGIRLVTPIGPIRLDYAIPTTGSRGGRTQFSIGQSF